MSALELLAKPYNQRRIIVVRDDVPPAAAPRTTMPPAPARRPTATPVAAPRTVPPVAARRKTVTAIAPAIRVLPGESLSPRRVRPQLRLRKASAHAA